MSEREWVLMGLLIAYRFAVTGVLWLAHWQLLLPQEGDGAQ
jgi:hypothetical protein